MACASARPQPLGVGAGGLVHTVAAALGVSAVLMASNQAYQLLLWLGAAYLVWLGWGLLGVGRGAAALVPAGDGAAAAAPSGTLASKGATVGEGSATAAVGLARPASPRAGDAAPSATRAFAQGFMTNVLNPKVALFFLAFLPQFIAPEAVDKALAFIALGLIFNINGTLVNLGFACAFAAVGRRLGGGGGGGRWTQWLGRCAGLLFIAMGLRLAFSGT